MKRPEERETPGRKRVYERPVNVTLFLPAELLDRAAQVEMGEGVKSRNAKLVALIEAALEQMDGGKPAVA